MEIIKIKNI